MPLCIRLFSVALLALYLALPLSARAAYPEHPLTLIVPFAKGGTTDSPARLLAAALEKKLGQPVRVLNITGGSGVTGVAQAASAAPDGYTLLYAPTGTIVLQPHLTMTPYSINSFSYIGNVMRVPVVLMTSRSAPWKTFQEMVDIVRKSPGKFRAGITGTNNMTHFPILDMAKHYGLDLRIVSYRSSEEVLKDMTAGHTHLFADPPIFLSRADIVGLAQFAAEPAEGVAAPTTTSLGYPREIAHWQGLFAPRGLSPEVMDTLGVTLREICTDPDFRTEVREQGTVVDWMAPEEFKTFVRKEFTEYGARVDEKSPR